MRRDVMGSAVLVLLVGCAPVKPYRVTNFFLDEKAIGDLREERVAVLPFHNQSWDETAGWKATNQFNLQLGKLGYFTLLERLRIDEIFEEQDLDPGRIDQATAVKIGKMLGAHGVILGAVTNYIAGKVGLSVRLVSVEKGTQIWQAQDTFDGRDPSIGALVEEGAERERLASDPDYLCQILARELVGTLER